MKAAPKTQKSPAGTDNFLKAHRITHRLFHRETGLLDRLDRVVPSSLGPNQCDGTEFSEIPAIGSGQLTAVFCCGYSTTM